MPSVQTKTLPESVKHFAAPECSGIFADSHANV